MGEHTAGGSQGAPQAGGVTKSRHKGATPLFLPFPSYNPVRHVCSLLPFLWVAWCLFTRSAQAGEIRVDGGIQSQLDRIDGKGVSNRDFQQFMHGSFKGGEVVQVQIVTGI